MRSTLDASHPYTGSALDAPPVVTGPVVLAIGPSEQSDASIRAAADIAAHLGASLEAVAVLEPLATYALGTEVMIASPALEQARRTDLESRSRDRLAHVLGDRPWRLDLMLGAPARVLATAASERNATMLIAGAGTHGVASQLLGTEVALQAVRLGDRPVLAIDNEWQGLPRRITCAMDFSPASVRVARLALRLLAPGGVLQFVLVTPPSAHIGLLGDSWLAAQTHAARERFVRLRALLEPELPPGAVLDEVLRPGLVVDEVLEAARAHRADLIAIGTQGRGFFERLFVGSAATGVLRRAERSVLCAPPPSAPERAWCELRMRGDARLEDTADWAPVLDDFTRRHAGRRSWLEVDDPATGAQLQQRGLTFVGATFDRHDRRIVLAFLDPANPTRHLTRDIAHVGWIALHAGALASDEVLCLAHGRGQTLLGFVGE